MKKPPAILLLAGAYLYIIFVLLSFDHAWMHVESPGIKKGILSHGRDLSWADWRLGLDYQLFEYAPRFTRPLSWYFELIDTKFRAKLWDFVCPHPSLSLTWLFSLILSPWLLYKFLRRWSVDANTAMCAVGLYLLNPGFLSTVVMLFRPSKAMVNFSILLCLYAGSVVYQRYQNKEKVSPRGRTLEFGALILLVFVSFFWDETALLIYPAIFLFFPGLWKQKQRLLIYLCLPAAVALFYFVVIPGVVSWAGHPVSDNLANYTVSFYEGTYYERFIRFVNYFFGFFPYLSTQLFKECFGLVWMNDSAPGIAKLLLMIGEGAATVLGFLVVINLRKLARQERLPKQFAAEMSLWFAGLLGLAVLHVGLMCLFRNVVLGLFWYGTYWTVFFVIFLARVFTYAQLNRYVLTFAVALIMVNLGSVFPSLNGIWKNYQYYHRFNSAELIDSGKISRFDPAYGPVYTGQQLHQAIEQQWKQSKLNRKDLNLPQDFPAELNGLVVELQEGRK